MDTQKLLPFFFTFSAPAEDRNELLQLMLPQLLDLEEASRPLVTAVTARQTVSRHHAELRRTGRRLVYELADAARLIAEKGQLTAEDMASLPTLARLGLKADAEAAFGTRTVPKTPAGGKASPKSN